MFLRLGWCLHGDAATVKSKLNELDAAGDLKAKERWMQERREEVEQRYKVLSNYTSGRDIDGVLTLPVTPATIGCDPFKQMDSR